MEAATPAISVAHLAKSFERPGERYTKLKERVVDRFRPVPVEAFAAVSDVSFEVARGEFLGLVGRNGSGKSTVLRCLAGIYGPDGGSVRVEGRVSPFIELQGGFNPELPARDNVILNAMFRGLTRRQAIDRFDQIVAFAELEGFADMKLRNYSSGMSVRLAFSVACHVDADVFLVDEVLAVGDSAFRRKCFDHFERLRADGRTVVFVSHRMEEIEQVCDRAILLEAGRIEAEGSPQEIAAAYERVNGLPKPPPRPAPPRTGPPPKRPPERHSPRRFAELTWVMAATEFRLHYMGSALGYLWSVVRPLLLFTVIYLMMTRVLRFGDGIEGYPAYLLLAIVLWTFFTETTGTAVSSLVTNGTVIRTLRFPQTVIPAALTLRALFNLGVNLAVVCVFLAVSHVHVGIAWLQLPLLLVVLVALATGAAMLLSALYVRFRDVGQIWTVFTQLLFYASPILYVVTQYPDSVRDLAIVNPLAAVFTQVRHTVIDPDAPTVVDLAGVLGVLLPLAVTALLLLAGLWFFRREAPRVAERL